VNVQTGNGGYIFNPNGNLIAAAKLTVDGQTGDVTGAAFNLELVRITAIGPRTPVVQRISSLLNIILERMRSASLTPPEDCKAAPRGIVKWMA
jgi:hypothetical protein